MANSMGRSLTEGEVVVLRKTAVREKYHALEERLIRVNGGFGMNDFSRGTALAARHLSDGEVVRWEGYDIDKKATEKWQAEFGQFGERWTGVDKTRQEAS